MEAVTAMLTKVENLHLQMAYDLAHACGREGDINVKPVARRKLHEPHP